MEDQLRLGDRRRRASGTASIIGDGIYRFTHRAQETGTGIWTDWVDNWVQIDSTAPTNTTVAPSTAWRQGRGRASR